MASAQVLPNSGAAATSSRKQGHLEAGKRRLEEFRKKKAEGRARKFASTGQLQTADVNNYGKSSQDRERVSDMSERDGATIVESPSLVINHGTKMVDSSQSTEIGSSNEMEAAYVNVHSELYGDLVQDLARDERSKSSESTGFSGPVNGYYDYWKEKSELSSSQDFGIEFSDGAAREEESSFHPVHVNSTDDYNNKQSNLLKLADAQSTEDKSSLKRYIKDPGISEAFLTSTLLEQSRSALEQNTRVFSNTLANQETSSGVEQYIPDAMKYDGAIDSFKSGGKIRDSIGRRLNLDYEPSHTLESTPMDSKFTSRSPSNQHPLPSTTYGIGSGRSRPSFLDFLNVPRASLSSSVSLPETVNADPPIPYSSLKSHSSQVHAVSSSQKPEADTVESSTTLRTPDSFGFKESSLYSSVSVSDGESLRQGFGDDNRQGRQEFPSSSKDEDFTALEQHIEDLTQEKFSLQRALDSSRALAESLATENSTLTDSFNQQGKVVNQLKTDMEQLQEEVRAQLMAAEAIKMEYANAQLESNAADERAKILASEVIGLEEKALRLRSNELKLEKQLENSNAEISSYKRKVSSLEKERRDFQSTIEALQEEKKLLQSKLRKPSSNGKVVDTARTPATKKDASTFTDDLGVDLPNLVNVETVTEPMPGSVINAVEEVGSPSVPSSGASSFPYQSESSKFYVPDASGVIPYDQLRMIENINSLISELALEKEELLRALAVQSSNNSKLKDLNKELSQKLEVQTQRFELLTAQRMANENVLPRSVDTQSLQDTMEYTDEGDEVVERVLGWIIKLFPGGPTKRRTSKLL